MPLKKKKDGSYAITSKSHVRAAIEEMALIEAQIKDHEDAIAKKCSHETTMIADGHERIAKLKESVEKFIKDKGDYEDEDIKLTRVQGFRRSWNAKKLEALVPRGVFKNLIKIEVVPAKVDEYVRQGKIERKKIESAFEETPNSPYVKWTEKSDAAEKGEDEAEGLAAALGL